MLDIRPQAKFRWHTWSQNDASIHRMRSNRSVQPFGCAVEEVCCTRLACRVLKVEAWRYLQPNGVYRVYRLILRLDFKVSHNVPPNLCIKILGFHYFLWTSPFLPSNKTQISIHHVKFHKFIKHKIKILKIY